MSNQPPNQGDPKQPNSQSAQTSKPTQTPIAQPQAGIHYNPYQTNEVPTQPMPNPGTPQQPYPNQQQPYQQPYPNHQQPYQQPYPNQQQPYPQPYPNQQQPYQQPYPNQQQPYQHPNIYDPNQPPPYQQYDPNQQYDPYQQQPYQQYDPNQQPTRQGLDLNQLKVNFEPTLAAPLCYLLFFVSGLYFLFTTEKDNRLVRFHAMQSIFFSAAWFVFYLASHIIYFAFSAFFAIIGLPIFLKLFTVFSNLVFLFLFGAWVMSMYRAYKGQQWKLPYIGDMAEKHIDSLNM